MAAAAVLLGLSGCGEKEEPATTGPVVPQSTSPIDGETSTTTTTNAGTGEQEATAAARAYLSSTDSETVCDELITPELLTQAYGNRQGCLAGRKPQTVAQSVTVQSASVQGSTATVTARAEGGQYGNGELVRLTLVRDGTAWRVSRAQ